MEDPDTVFAVIGQSPHTALLIGGGDIYVYWGEDKEQVRERLSAFRLVLIGANIDTDVIWLLTMPSFRAVYDKLRNVVGSEHIHLIGPQQIEQGEQDYE